MGADSPPLQALLDGLRCAALSEGLPRYVGKIAILHHLVALSQKLDVGSGSNR
jgi:hypothetical protein